MIFSIYISSLNGFSMEQYVKDHAIQNSALPAGNCSTNEVHQKSVFERVIFLVEKHF